MYSKLERQSNGDDDDESWAKKLFLIANREKRRKNILPV